MPNLFVLRGRLEPLAPEPLMLDGGVVSTRKPPRETPTLRDSVR